MNTTPPEQNENHEMPKKVNRDASEKTHAAITAKGSALKKYQKIIVGSDSIAYTLYFELCQWLGCFPGAIGLGLRKIFWPRLFQKCGKGVLFAKGIVLRHPKRMVIGNDVIISEGVILDARYEGKQDVLILEDNVILSNNVLISCKNATVRLGEYTGVGPQTIIQSVGDCNVDIGRDVIIGPHCYIVGGGSYNMEDTTMPIWRQGNKFDNGCVLADNVWLGANVTVLGGLTINSGSVIAANAVVNKDVTAGDIIGGVPGKTIKNRFTPQ